MTQQPPFPGAPQQQQWPQQPQQQQQWPQQPQMQQPPPQQQAWPQQPQQGQAAYNPHSAAGMPGAQAGHAFQNVQQPQGLPTIFLPDEQLIAEAQQRAVEEQQRIARARSGGKKFLKLKTGPNGLVGEEKWDNAPVGTEARLIAWLCPPWAPGVMPMLERHSHFWKSQRQPKGDSVPCIGAENGCLVCIARNLLYKMGDEASVARANNNGRSRRSALMQLITLEDLQSHFDPTTGKMEAHPFEGPGQVYDDILGKIKTRGIARIVDPGQGRPLILIKKKTGPTQMDVEWRVDDLDPQPLPQAYWPILHNLTDLTKFIEKPNIPEVIRCIQEMQFPMSQEAGAALAQWNAEQQQIQMAAQQAQLAAGTLAPQGMVPGQPQQPGFQNQQQAWPQQPQMQMAPPQQMQQAWPQQPGFQNPPQQPMQMAAAPPQEMQPFAIPFPVPPGVQLPEGRQQCFGNNDESYQLCQRCPPWVKQQCLPVTIARKGQPQQQAQQGPALTLEQLQQQLQRR